MSGKNFVTNFQHTLDKFKRQNEAFVNDMRPVTGMVGQKCRGFYTDMYGNLIRLVPEERGEEHVGPGSYSPEKPNTFKKTTTISSNSKRTLFLNNSFPVGPSDHFQPAEATKLPHKIQDKDKSKKAGTFLSGNLEHSQWGTPPSQLLPKRRFPQIKFVAERNSRPFASREARTLFPTNEDALTKASELRSLKDDTIDVSDRESACFRTSPQRFPDYSSSNPAPSTYNPRPLDQGRKTSLCPTWSDLDIDPPLITPGPGEYDNSKPKKTASILPPPRSKFIPKELIPKRTPVVDRDPFSTPPPGAYEIKAEETDKIPALIKNRDSLPTNDWAMTPELMTNTPNVGAYNIEPRKRIKGGVMTVVGHRDPVQDHLERDQNHKLQFSTPHSSLLKRTFNVKYYQLRGESSK